VREKFVLVVRLEELDVSNVDPLIVVGIKLAPADASRLAPSCSSTELQSSCTSTLCPLDPLLVPSQRFSKAYVV
jgi:hypothetical protein